MTSLLKMIIKDGSIFVSTGKQSAHDVFLEDERKDHWWYHSKDSCSNNGYIADISHSRGKHSSNDGTCVRFFSFSDQ